jgi:DsbC/DsbD-like thiol-disulfide interchange protein
MTPAWGGFKAARSPQRDAPRLGKPRALRDARAMTPRQTLLAALCCAALALPQTARALDVIAGEILPGWRLADGSHMAGLRLTLAPGWKTYWRAPGDAGIPPRFDWNGSQNLRAVEIAWPVPQIFDQNGMRSIVYADEVVLPLHVHPLRAGAPVRLDAEIELGVCEDICIPAALDVGGLLPADVSRPDPAIAAALAARPLSAAEAGVRRVACSVAPGARGLRLTAEIEMPRAGRTAAAVIETGDPEVWVSEPDLDRVSSDRLAATSVLEHMEGGAFALDRGALRITLLGAGVAVDIQGCPAK